MASSAAYSSKLTSSSMSAVNNPIKEVYVDAMVILKIIKHAHEETTDAAQGGLLGLVNNSTQTLEITNCFPFPNQNKPENIDLGNLEQFQADIIRSLRRVNSDYLQVGFYDSCFNRSLVQAMIVYQQSGVEESIALVYDQALATQGYISVKAYRLTPVAIEQLKSEDVFSPDSVKEAKLNYDNMMDEIPVVFRNSHLVNSLLCEIDEQTPLSSKYDTFLDLGSSGNIDRQLRSLIDCVDEFGSHAQRFNNYQKQFQRHQSKRSQNDRTRRSDGLDEELDRITKLHADSRRNALLNSAQIKNQCENITKFTSQQLAKLFMAEAVQEKN
ncbi:unnamed protein product [Didymodactylos carnosus]|uniref:MPN domain-containing protein n=1 Tax=Didymodactylos carnosus TaxID=1234261 RepID=A0A814EH46_9BILA|nr:unnamed protein product [Didymodactylos carnosus]CAF0967619.1 unnamed protein product [Didymodactylos carnosus]CAF3596483.1 unnamed protein product [Didymodactylos carnosus]CAF3740976.1 unnamed protein product [Didymodactylos carnosus]